jgi:recombination protein RecR
VKIPRPILRLIESFERLPGIGPKTAQRLTFHLLHFPQEDLERFADSLIGLKTKTQLCSVCKNVSEYDKCSVCDDTGRDTTQILVVSNPLDVFAIEKTGYGGVYHVLHGVIDPLNHMGPEELFIGLLKSRLDKHFVQNEGTLEIILGTNTSLEGESTAMYISKLIRESGYGEDRVKITRIARGLPVGGDIEYADDITLSRALEGRAAF